MHDFFTKGKLSVILDGQAGSSGKGVIGSYLAKDGVDFACNAFSAQAGHWVKPDAKRAFFYQTFNSNAYNHEKCGRFLIGPDASIELVAFRRELEENSIPVHKVGISPFAGVIQEKDQAYERGEVDFDGYNRHHLGTMAHGSTCHGVGAARARRMLRRPDALLAKDVPSLKPFLTDVPGEIMSALDRGQSGLLEIAQGFQLSLLHRFYPAVTSRNVTVSAGLDGMMVPPRYAGNVLLNFRSYPIRINSNKYLSDGKHLTWKEVEQFRAAGKSFDVYEGDSGGWYPDQRELTWEELTKNAGSPTPIMEMTSVTKLPRRVASFSTDNLLEAVRYNRAPDGFETWIKVNFMNYVDHAMSGRRGGLEQVTTEAGLWLSAYVDRACGRGPAHSAREVQASGAVLKFLGTGPLTDDHVTL